MEELSLGAYPSGVQMGNAGLKVLPALPAAWPAGSVRGLRARGGFEVDIAWEDGKLQEAVIRSHRGKTCQVRTDHPLSVRCGGKPVATKTRGDILLFDTRPGGIYVLRHSDW